MSGGTAARDLVQTGRAALSSLTPQNIIVIVAALVAMLPVIGVRYLPIQDLPFHEGTIRTFASYGNGSSGLSEVYQLAPGKTQYLLFYFGGAAMSKLVGVRTATQLMIAFYLAGTVLATASLLRALEKNELGALLVLPVLYNKSLVIGFLPFLLGIPLLLWSLAHGIRFLDAPTRKNGIRLALLTVVLFLSHVAPFTYFWCGFAAVTLVYGPRYFLKAAVVSVPAIALFIAWTFGTEAGLATRRVFTEKGDTPWAYDQVFRDTYALVFDVFRDHSDEAHVLLWIALLVLAVGLGQGDAAKARPVARVLWVLPVLALFMFLRAPHRVGYVAHIKDRFPILFLFTLVPLLRLPTGWRGNVVAGLALVVGASASLNARRHFAEASSVEAGGLDEMIDGIPQRATVAGLVFDPSSKVVHQAPWLHAAHWATVDKSAVVQFSFVGYPHWPVEYRPGQTVMRVLEVGEGFSWSPATVSVPDLLVPNFDYVLTRGAGFRPPPGTFEQIRRREGWGLWKNTTR